MQMRNTLALAMCALTMLAYRAAAEEAAPAEAQAAALKLIAQGGLYAPEQVPTESLQESIEGLTRDLVAMSIPSPQADAAYLSQLREVPRVAKLMDIARGGSPSDRAALRQGLVAACEGYVTELPPYVLPEHGQAQGSIHVRLDEPLTVFSWALTGAVAYPLILAETDLPRRDLLDLLCRMNARTQEALQGLRETSGEAPDTGKMTGNPQVTVLALVAKDILDASLKQAEVSPAATPAGERAALKTYEKALAADLARRPGATELSADFCAMHFGDVLGAAEAMRLAQPSE